MTTVKDCNEIATKLPNAAAVAMVDSVDANNCTLQSLVNQKSLKWIFVGGKGGVGKTTTSCSIAVELSRHRENVLILSTDPAHNLSDAFVQKIGNKPTPVQGFSNLYAMELSAAGQQVEEVESNSLLDGSEGGGEFNGTLSKLLPELLSTFPGIDEAVGFAELMNSVRSMSYSVIVFDTAPTGHTMRLIGFPNLLEKALDKLAALRDRLSPAFNLFNTMTGNSINEEEIHQKLDSLRSTTAAVRECFQDPTRTTFVCVCIPEFLSVYETERLVQALASHDIDSSNIVVNQVLFPIVEAEDIYVDWTLASEGDNTEKLHSPEETEDESKIRKLQIALRTSKRRMELFEANFLARRRMQSKYLQQIEDLYSGDFAVVPVALQSTEVRGVPMLRKFAELLLSPRRLPIVQHQAGSCRSG